MTARHDLPTLGTESVPMTPERQATGGLATTARRRQQPPLALVAGLLAMAVALPTLIVSVGEGPLGDPTASVHHSTPRIQRIVAMDWFGAGPAGRRDSIGDP